MADDERTREKKVLETREAAVKEWQASMEAGVRASQESGIDWSKVKVDPQDVGVRMGPMLTEEEFKAMWCGKGQKKPHIIAKKQFK
jgi:hypothetical protein